ncbi:hypothetical protein Goklo_002308 [Gossypium klotzschianum]|uniref:Uncharacterized protein n=1 Tax=Gossypium klotzschianum TaxID=34286 RepID=A0A7J8VSP9_9ROSI|nr:hypothetical protein [Gossypium klotzschianum]
MAWGRPLQCFDFYSPPNVIFYLLYVDAHRYVTPRMMST